MTLSFRPTQASELQQVRRFLQAGFAAPAEAPFLQDRQLYWKFYATREDWPDSRSYIMDSGSGIAAHICAWPIQADVGNGDWIPGLHPIDWLADTTIPGSGALLLRSIRTVKDFCCCVGGTEIARKVIAQTGFKPAGKVVFYARPLRPAMQILTHQRRNWKLPLRFVRNTFWTLRTTVHLSNGWSARPIEPGKLPESVLPVSNGSLTATRRSPDLFRYLLACPVMKYQLCLVEHNGAPTGYFLLSTANRQARIADLWSATSEGWASVAALAIDTARRAGRTAEITACASIPAVQQALEACGFRRTHDLDLMLFDGHKRLKDCPPLHFQMINNDFSYLHENRVEYLT